MLIPLEHPIWTRLYGPYGIEDWAGILHGLSQRWDATTARDLYWEKLHHQDDLYPATFAALPWIWHLAPRPLRASEYTPLFLSHVLDCALRPGGTGPRGEGPRGRYRGLVAAVEAHQWDWLPADRRLRQDDLPVLERLETWFGDTAPDFVETCLGLVDGEDHVQDASLLCGPAAWLRGFALPFALTLWGDGLGLPIILNEAPPETPDDRKAAMALARAIAASAPDLASFLQGWAET